jgi:hypothetical protein
MANCASPADQDLPLAGDGGRETGDDLRADRPPRRFGLAQVLAGLLLLAFCAQGFWLLLRTPLGEAELDFSQGAEIRGGFLSPAVASPVTALAAHAASVGVHEPWACRLPFLLVGILLGASVWYIARRLYGNHGGYVALTLYAFSPSMVTSSARVQPEIIAAWGIFGCIFTAIAVAHTLYAPRHVIRWNWKRIALLGLALGVGAGAQVSALVALVFGLAFMLYLAPERRGIAMALGAASLAIGLAVFAALHGFRWSELLASTRDTGGFTLRMLVAPAVWRMLGVLLLHNSPGFVLLLALSLVTLVVWRRARFFGNLAPLLTATALIGFGWIFPHAAGFTFLVAALPFLFVFTAGVCADLLESRQAPLASGMISAALVMHAYFSVSGLWRL